MRKLKKVPYKLLNKGKPRLASIVDLTKPGTFKIVHVELHTKYTEVFIGAAGDGKGYYPEISISTTEESLHCANAKADSINIAFPKYRGYNIVASLSYRYGHDLILFKPKKRD